MLSLNRFYAEELVGNVEPVMLYEYSVAEGQVGFHRGEAYLLQHLSIPLGSVHGADGEHVVYLMAVVLQFGADAAVGFVFGAV